MDSREGGGVGRGCNFTITYSYLLNKSGEYFLAKYSSPPLYPVGVRFIEKIHLL
jgi:hypothetical protein